MRIHFRTTGDGTPSAVICTSMRYRLALMIAAIVALSAMPMVADYRDDRGLMAEVDRKPLVEVRGNIEVRSAEACLSPAQLREFASTAENAAAGISRFTGVPPRKHIVIYLSPSIGISHTYTGSSRHDPRVFIDSDRVANHTAPYIHELVHAVVGDGGAMWLEEGFAEWVASSVATKYGGYYAAVMTADNDRIDTQARSVMARSPNAGEARTWFTEDEPHLSSQHERRAFYILAHSFTKYLATTLGTSRLVTIHRADDVHALAKVSGVSNAEWERRWLAELGGGEKVARR